MQAHGPDRLHTAVGLLRQGCPQGRELGQQSRTLRRRTSSAMALPRRVITTTSPASTASSSLESWLLASATVTCSLVVDHLDDQP